MDNTISETDIFVHMNTVKYSAILALIGNAVMMMRSRVIIVSPEQEPHLCVPCPC